MTLLLRKLLFALATLPALLNPLPAAAQGELVVYCTVQEEWCRPMVAAFEKATGIKVLMTRKSSGEFYAQIKAEAANPRGDIWWGGTGDPHMQAAEEGLTEAYKSPKLAELQDWAVRQAESAKYRTVGIYAGALGYSYNTEQLKKNGAPEPKCWADLIKPAFKDEIQVANPNSSGTSYTMLATMVQIMGEDKAFDYLKALHKNVNQYTKSGAAPARAVATGESLVGITFQHDAVIQALGGAPVKIVSPCEGTGYEIGSMSLIKGAKNMENAKKWYDWALSVEGQAIGAANKVSYQVPSNKNAPVPAAAPKLADIKLINYDFAKYGSSAERKRLLSKWDTDVSNLPK
jgi:iron(III) transport system substrate-binding protein